MVAEVDERSRKAKGLWSGKMRCELLLSLLLLLLLVLDRGAASAWSTSKSDIASFSSDAAYVSMPMRPPAIDDDVDDDEDVLSLACLTSITACSTAASASAACTAAFMQRSDVTCVCRGDEDMLRVVPAAASREPSDNEDDDDDESDEN